MTRTRAAAILVLTGVLFGVHSTATRGSGPATAARPDAGPPPSVYALGRLEPAGTVLRIGAPAGGDAGRVAELRVREGQRVEASEVLAVMDTFAIKAARVREAEARVEAARARLRQSEASAKEAELEAGRADIQRLLHRVQAARRTRGRLAALRAEGVVSTEAADAARSAVAEAEQEHRRALARLAGLEQVRSVDLDLRRAEVKVAEATAAIARADLRTAQVRAPRAGTVLRVHARAGELPGATACSRRMSPSSSSPSA
ncbi:MAG: hypothetical protein AAFX50_02600, partial [Acidobacteriota bacterium]